MFGAAPADAPGYRMLCERVYMFLFLLGLLGASMQAWGCVSRSCLSNRISDLQGASSSLGWAAVFVRA